MRMDIGDEAAAVESAAMKKAMKSISAIEVALAEWEGSRDKPPHVAWKIERLRKAHTLLSEWARGSLSGQNDTASRLARLRGFADIYSELYPDGGV